MTGVFCTNNAQAPSLFSNVTLTSRRSDVSTYDRLLVSVTLERGRELVHCLYKKLQTCLPTSRRPAKPYLIII